MSISFFYAIIRIIVLICQSRRIEWAQPRITYYKFQK